MIKNHLNDKEKKIYEFFCIFSRFEYSLKRCKYLENGDFVKPDWIKFSQELDRKYKQYFFENIKEEFEKAKRYLFEYPPKKQIIKNQNRLGWMGGVTIVYTDQSFEKLLCLVRRVRNNLFHGGKFETGPVDGSERNMELINSSIIVLKECLSLNSCVFEVFNEN